MTDPNHGVYLQPDEYKRLCELARIAKRCDCTILRPLVEGGPWLIRRYGVIAYEASDLDGIEHWLTA